MPGPPPRRSYRSRKGKAFTVHTDPRAAPPPANRALPRWAVKPVRLLTTGELAEALEYLERHRPEDDVLGRALAGEFARRTAAAEFARRAAGDRPAASRAPQASRPADPAGPQRPR